MPVVLHIPAVLKSTVIQSGTWLSVGLSVDFLFAFEFKG